MELVKVRPAVVGDFAYRSGQILLLSVLLINAYMHPGLTLVILIGATGLFVVHERPDIGFWVLIVLTPIESIGPISFGASKVAKLAFTGIIGLVLYAESFTGASERHENPYRWPFALAVIAGIPASLLAKSRLMSFAGLGTLLVFVLFYTAVRRHAGLVERGQLLVKIVMAGAVLSSLLCFYQLTHGYSGVLASAEQQDMEADQSYDTLWPLISRASAAFNGPNAAGAFLAMGMIAGLMHAQIFRKSRHRYLLVALTCLAGVLTTFSRGALLGSIGGCAFALWAMGALSRFRTAALIGLIAVLAGTAGLNDQVKSYFRIGADIVSASPTRVDAWHAATVMLKRNPVFGIGFYEFHELSQGIIGSSDTPIHPHNGFLKALVEEGPIGGFAYLLFLGTFLVTSKRSLRQPFEAKDRWVLASIAGIGASLFIQELFDAGFALGSSSVAILFASLLAVQTSLYSPTKEQPNASAPMMVTI